MVNGHFLNLWTGFPCVRCVRKRYPNDPLKLQQWSIINECNFIKQWQHIQSFLFCLSLSIYTGPYRLLQAQYTTTVPSRCVLCAHTYRETDFHLFHLLLPLNAEVRPINPVMQMNVINSTVFHAYNSQPPLVSPCYSINTRLGGGPWG